MMKKRKEAEFDLKSITSELRFIGKGMFARRAGDIIEIYKRQFNTNPKRTLVQIIVVSVILGLLLGAILWY